MIKASTGLKISRYDVAKAMKKRFQLRYGRVKQVPLPGNSERNKVLRALYAQAMLPIYDKGHHVVNVDETWLPETDFRRFGWRKRGVNSSAPEQVMKYKINLITAISSEGYAWMALT